MSCSSAHKFTSLSGSISAPGAVHSPTVSPTVFPVLYLMRTLLFIFGFPQQSGFSPFHMASLSSQKHAFPELRETSLFQLSANTFFHRVGF